MAKKAHPGHGHKHGKGMGHGDGHGSNLKLPATKQSLHLQHGGDSMAQNVGGSAHMQVDAKSMGYQDVILSGGGKLKKAKLKY